eukprot:COSAG01_NODE_31655_length_593_cov_1.904858_1_plen_51_part_10
MGLARAVHPAQVALAARQQQAARQPAERARAPPSISRMHAAGAGAPAPRRG